MNKIEILVVSVSRTKSLEPSTTLSVWLFKTVNLSFDLNWSCNKFQTSFFSITPQEVYYHIKPISSISSLTLASSLSLLISSVSSSLSSSSSDKSSIWAAAISSNSSKSGNGYRNIAATPDTCCNCYNIPSRRILYIFKSSPGNMNKEYPAV